jgi:hypothetical protein
VLARNRPIIPRLAIQNLQPPTNGDRTLLNDSSYPIGSRPLKISSFAAKPLEQQTRFSLRDFEDLKTYPVAAAQMSYNEPLPPQE